jgi:hypothetical protein
MSTVNIIHEVTVTPNEFRNVLLSHVGTDGIPVVTHVMYTSLVLSYPDIPPYYAVPISFIEALNYFDNNTLGTYSVRMGSVIFVTSITE